LEGSVYNSAAACPGVYELLDGGKIFALDESKTFIVSSKGDGSLVFYMSCKLPESWIKDCGIDFADQMQVLNWFKKEFAGWADSWDELFLNAVAPFIPRPLYCMPPDQTWETLSNLTMLGDAAHLMPPFAGEGVNMAMLDSLELTNCLLNPDFFDAHTAIAAYEQQMLARAAEVIGLTLQQTESMHSPEGLSNLLQLFSQLPPE
jgi:2-polyprenyl-6-methoxyphenol hydroxylase-like FAD-dependent oxidoreductase